MQERISDYTLIYVRSLPKFNNGTEFQLFNLCSKKIFFKLKEGQNK